VNALQEESALAIFFTLAMLSQATPKKNLERSLLSFVMKTPP
jgi:hypothetical protein